MRVLTNGCGVTVIASFFRDKKNVMVHHKTFISPFGHAESKSDECQMPNHLEHFEQFPFNMVIHFLL